MTVLSMVRAATRPMRQWIARPQITSQVFNHAVAQRYEFASNRRDIAEHFPRLRAALDEEIADGGVWFRPGHHWWANDVPFFETFIAHLRNRKSLEIGSGPFGFLAFCPWLSDRTIIDPLIESYRGEQLRLFGRTFFEDITRISEPAETLIPSLVRAIDGCIICQNALDHCEDPLTILNNIAAYAAPGCYLLLWSDIWHVGLDEGHRNITRSQAAMDAILAGFGFDIAKQIAPIRSDGCIEYGVVARRIRS